MIALKNKDIDKAREYALLTLSNKDSLSERQLAGLYALLIEIESSAKNYSKALEYSGEYEKIMENIDEYERHNLIQEIEHKYKNRQLKDKLEAEGKYHFYQLKIISLLIFLAIIIALYIINHLVKRKRRIIIEKNKEIEIYKIMADDLASNYTELKNLYDRLGVERDKEDETETRFMKALDNRLKGLGDLLEEAYLFENKPERFLKTFKDYVKESSAQEFAFSDLRYIVNKKYCGIVDYLQKTYSDLSESDLDLCSMICFGFSSNSIRQIYAHTNPDSIYNKRSKLRNKLKLGPSIQIEGFIRNLLAELSRKETA